MYHLQAVDQILVTWPNYGTDTAIRNVLAFNFKYPHYIQALSSSELQNMILRAQAILSTLYLKVKEYDTPYGSP